MAFILVLCFLRSGGQYHLRRRSLSSQPQFRSCESLSQNALYRGIGPSRSADRFETLLLLRERRKDRSCPRSPAGAALTCENTPESSDRASRSTRNRETSPAECLCSPAVQGELHPMCTTRAERLLDRLHRACTATVCLPESECFVGLLRDFRLSAKPSIFGSDPKRPRAPLHMHSRSVKSCW